MEAQLIMDYHIARSEQLALQVIEDMKRVRPGGLFEGYARIGSLWDEASWALQESKDPQAEEAASDTISQFASATVAGMLTEEMRLHCYLLTEDVEDDSDVGLPWANEDAVVREVTDRVTIVKHRRLWVQHGVNLPEERSPCRASAKPTYASRE